MGDTPINRRTMQKPQIPHTTSLDSLISKQQYEVNSQPSLSISKFFPSVSDKKTSALQEPLLDSFTVDSGSVTPELYRNLPGVNDVRLNTGYEWKSSLETLHPYKSTIDLEAGASQAGFHKNMDEIILKLENYQYDTLTSFDGGGGTPQIMTPPVHTSVKPWGLSAFSQSTYTTTCKVVGFCVILSLAGAGAYFAFKHFE